MTDFDSEIENVSDSVLIGKFTAELGWMLKFGEMAGDNITHTHRWTYRNTVGDIEVVFWLNLDYSLDAAVKYRVFDSATAFPVAGSRDIIDALELLR